MRIALLGFLAVVVGVALGLAGVFLGIGRVGDAAGGGVPSAELSGCRAELRALDERMGRLERSVTELARPQAAREVVTRVPRLPALDPSDGSDASDGGAGSASPTAALDPRRLLAEYVASFADGGEGSDFFRMAVAAYAWQLRRELHAIVVDADAPDALRLQVMAMFDGGSFRGDDATLDALLEVLRQGGWEQGATQALEILAKIGDRRTAELLEALAPGLAPLRVRAAAWGAIAQLCGGDADAVLLRLLEREHETEGRQQLIALFRGTGVAATVRAYELASRMEKEVRLDAAGRIGRFRDERFVALTQEWLVRETDEEVRQRLAAALDQQKQVPAWHELQATGAPNVASIANDDQHAWAPAAADGGREWLELTYAPALVANRVTIHETCAAGCVIAVEVMEEGGTWRTVWSGDDPLQSPGPFEVRFERTRAAVSRVRVTLDTKRRSGWNEIDAVELAGPDGAAWAANAVASSRYGEGAASGWGNFLDGGSRVRAKALEEDFRKLIGGR